MKQRVAAADVPDAENLDKVVQHYKGAYAVKRMP